ncbi:MAG: GNAT family N-acetyltransferase [Anaerolineae bacterium]|nr:GNAT family N-acetyltransferase [Anaerolineae bacterium]
MTHLSLQENSIFSANGLRPVNLRTDLAPLADLIEMVFADSMDQSGRAAIREMRYLSRMGIGLSLLPGMNDLVQGISLGYVWIADGKLVGNVSVYPAKWPQAPGKAWIIANVGVHPVYQGRGIATQLMRASMEMIRSRGGQYVILQVDSTNDVARHIYQHLGFVDERAWTVWRRNSAIRAPLPLSEPTPFITRRRREEWQAEYLLAQRLRPANKGGLGWQRPLHPSFFKKSIGQQLADLLNMRSLERLVIRSEEPHRLLASMWIETGLLVSATQITLMVDPAYQETYGEVLINYVTRRHDIHNHLTIEHPSDETVIADLLSKYQFRPQREVIHMRWDVP